MLYIEGCEGKREGKKEGEHVYLTVGTQLQSDPHPSFSPEHESHDELLSSAGSCSVISISAGHCVWCIGLQGMDREAVAGS